MEREENNALQQAGFKLSISWVIGMSSTTVPTTIVFYTMFSLNVIKVYLDIGRDWASFVPGRLVPVLSSLVFKVTLLVKPQNP